MEHASFSAFAYEPWSLEQGQTLTVSNVVSGPGTLSKLGLGTLTLSGTNTFSGGVVLAGGTLSVARDANVPAIYAEYHGAATCDYEGVDAYVDGCLNVMAEVGMIDRQPPPSRVKHVVEDERHGSGHMQVQNPAPIEGFFEPEVTLGQRIESEDPIGTVCDVLGDDVRIVRSAQSGIVLMLKSFSRVDKDEGVGVVLESDRPLGGGPGGGGSS